MPFDSATPEDFYPRSPCGERRVRAGATATNMEFLSTLSLRRATCNFSQKRHPPHNFYPRSPCGERLVNTYHRIFGGGISIHALLAESDSIFMLLLVLILQFLSTLSLRRATEVNKPVAALTSISIHALLAESDISDAPSSAPYAISIHALLAESDSRFGSYSQRSYRFLSTLSLRRATLNQIPPRRFHYHFYPRSPCGERPWKRYLVILGRGISIHALLAESDISCAWSASKLGDFYPRSPCGERPGQNLVNSVRGIISIHALLAESD